MLHQFLLWSIFGPGLLKGILLCPGDDWNLYGSKCYKITDEDVSYEEGQSICTNETINSTLVMPKTKQEVEFIKSLYSNSNIWLGLRFRVGSVWMWNDNTKYDASMLLSWSNGNPNNAPHLCIYIFDGYMYDYDCLGNPGVVCQRDQENCPTDQVWKHNGLWCYIVLLDMANGVTYDEAKDMCSYINGTVIMPKTKEDAEWIANNLDYGGNWWIGLVDYDADYVYTWEDGTNQHSSTLYWYPGARYGIPRQPNGRDNACLCAVTLNGEMNDVDCSKYNKVVCQVDARTELPTTLYDQTTNHVNLETTTLPTETTIIPATFDNQSTNYANLETTTLPTETTIIPATFDNQSTNYANLETTTLPTETTIIPATFDNQSTNYANLETTTLPTETTIIPATFDNQSTNYANLETTTLPTETTIIPATFDNQSTNYANLETTTLPTETTIIPATFDNQSTNYANLETTTLPTETTIIPATFDNQSTNYANLETTTLPTETTIIPATFDNQSTNYANLETTTLPTETTIIPATFDNQSTNYANLETTTLPTKTTIIPAIFDNQSTNYANLETTTLSTETTIIPATFDNQSTNYANLETTTLPTKTTIIPATFYNQTTNHAKLETTTLPATNMSLTLTSLECEALWMNQRNCNCQEPSASPEKPNDIITYRLDKTMLSSYIRKKSSASDPRKSSFYIGCVGIIVLVLSVLFIVVLDFIPRG